MRLKCVSQSCSRASSATIGIPGVCQSPHMRDSAVFELATVARRPLCFQEMEIFKRHVVLES